MEIKKMVKSFEYGKLTISFKGVLPMGERVDMEAKYDVNGNMIDCSSAYSSRNSADYYIEIAEVFKMMKELEGDRIKEIINEVKNKKSTFDQTFELLNKEINQINLELTSVRNEYEELNKKLKRSRSEKTINELTEKLNEIKPNYLDLLDKKELSTECRYDIYYKMEKSIQFAI